MFVRRVLLGAAAVVAVGIVAWQGWGQQYEIEAEAYRVRVVNQMGIPICVKIIPYGRDTYFHADLRPGQSMVQNLYAGHRVMCVWDDRNGRLVIAAGLLVNRDGVLRIRPLYVATPAPGAAEDATPRAAAAGLPAVEIEEDR